MLATKHNTPNFRVQHDLCPASNTFTNPKVVISFAHIFAETKESIRCFLYPTSKKHSPHTDGQAHEVHNPET